MPNDTTGAGTSSTWADRAAALYDDGYAKRYRHRDGELEHLPSHQQLLSWLGDVCDRFERPIDVLDLGCGTGRYFWGLRHVVSLVGLDASTAMLDEARHPVHGASPSVPRTPQRRAAAVALAALPAPMTSALHRRFVNGGLYADERWVAYVLAPTLAIESLDRFQSDVHLHTRCVARKPE